MNGLVAAIGHYMRFRLPFVGAQKTLSCLPGYRCITIMGSLKTHELPVVVTLLRSEAVEAFCMT
jgi:hypothetical protein